MVVAEKILSIVSDSAREEFKSWIDGKVNNELGKGTISQGGVHAYQYAQHIATERSLVEAREEMQLLYRPPREDPAPNDYERESVERSRGYRLAAGEILDELDELLK